MTAYQTLVVGTDGSDTSLRAVDHAAALAADNNAQLIIAMAHLPNVDKGGWGRPARPDRVIDGRAEVVLRDEGDYIVHGMAPIYAILREARDRARAAGAKNIDARPILVGHLGGPAHALSRLADPIFALVDFPFDLGCLAISKLALSSLGFAFIARISRPFGC